MSVGIMDLHYHIQYKGIKLKWPNWGKTKNIDSGMNGVKPIGQP
jgi:hypothetical protein